MGYKNKAHGDKINAALSAKYAAPRRLHCAWCAVSGHGFHTLELTPDGAAVVCPRCGDSRPASDADRTLYGGAS